MWRRRYAHLQTRLPAECARCQTTPFCFYIKIFTHTHTHDILIMCSARVCNHQTATLHHSPCGLYIIRSFVSITIFAVVYIIILLCCTTPAEGDTRVISQYINLLLTEGTRLFAPLLRSIYYTRYKSRLNPRN